MTGYCTYYYDNWDCDEADFSCEDYLDCEDCPYWEESGEE